MPELRGAPKVDVVTLVNALAGLPDATPVELTTDEEVEVFASNRRELDAISNRDPAAFFHAWRHAGEAVDVDDVEERKRRLAVTCRRALADAEELKATADFYHERGEPAPPGLLRLWRYARAMHAWASGAANLLHAHRAPAVREMAFSAGVERRSHWRRIATIARRELRAQLLTFSPPRSRQCCRAPRNGRRSLAVAGERSPPGSEGSQDDPPLGAIALVRRPLGRLAWP